MPIITTGLKSVSISARVGVTVKEGVRSSSSSSNVLPLQFTTQPQSKTVDEYALATFSCEVSGGVAPYSYQWKKNAANVGTNSAALSFAAAATDKNSSITVVVTDSVGAVITSASAVLGVTSYAFQLDGVTQYFSLSGPVTFSSGDSVEFDIVFPVSSPSADAYIIDGSTRAYLFIKPDNTFFYNQTRVKFTLDGVPLSAGDQVPLDGLSHKVVGTYQGTHTLQMVGISYPLTGGTTLSCKIRKLGMDRVAGNIDIPLNNKSQGANQLATVGSINATIINYNAAGWVAI